MSKINDEHPSIYEETANISANSAKVNDYLESDRLKYPFSEKLKKDEYLTYSPINPKSTDLLKKKFPSKTTVETFKEVIDFPTPYIFGKFALKAYENYDPRQKEQYKKDLPEGWTLLTTATNNSINNGYFGVAYCNLKKQQVILAHRGTIISNLGAVWTDISGIGLKKYKSQMNSACTFSHEIIGVLNKLNKDRTNFQLFFTGHSLGGWLAQITTFTSKYLDIFDNIFLKAKQEGYHAHTIVFDSPGCKDMLIQMKNDFGLRHENNRYTLSIDDLDITSYLSAPNRINTLNSHVGTMYRIYVDLSDWNENFKYTLETHSMEKILNVFDQSTGQVRKNNDGTKIKKVIDWPISKIWLLNYILPKGNKEYNNLFRWANQFNNYEPEVKSDKFQDELKEKLDHFPIRYQVENVNWNICTGNVFTQEEFLFLENYQTLRKLPENFKPKDLFNNINDLETEQNIKDVLGDFKIKNKIIICENEKLQKFIYYVKNLLHFYPKIKDKIEKGFTKNGIKKAIIESISLNNLVCEQFQHFEDIDAEKRLLNMNTQVSLLFVNEDTRLWLARIYKSLYETYDKKKVIILNLKKLLHLKKKSYFTQEMKDFVDELTSKKSLILLECKLNFNINENKEIKNFTKYLFLKLNNEKIKVIFVARISHDDKLEDLIKSTANELKISCETKNKMSLTWFNFSAKFKEELLNRPLVVYQEQKEGISLMNLKGDKITWEDFIDSNKDPKFLMHLINNENIKIESTCPELSGYDESYYINRVLFYQVKIKTKIFENQNNKDDLWAISGTDKETFTRLIPKNSKIRLYHESDPDKEIPIKFIILDSLVAEKFSQLCQQYPKFNIHLLKYKPNENKLIWKKSQGSICELLNFVDSTESQTIEYNETLMLKKTSKHKVVIVSDTAGMGKSTVLTKIYHLIKSESPNLWLFRINLIDYTNELLEIKNKNTLNIDKNDKIKEVFNFLSKSLSEATSLKQTLFKFYCHNETNISKMIIMFDGFDEISPAYKEVVLEIVQLLRKSAIKQIWITTRPQMLKDLVGALKQFAFTLKPFSVNDQQNFLTNFWSKKILDYNIEDQDRLKEFVKTLIEKFANSINDTKYEFTGIPLQTRMLAEIFQKPCTDFLKSKEDKPDLPNNFKVFDLYESFFKKKHELYLVEKVKVDLSKQGIESNLLYEEFIGSYQIIALHTIFNEEMLNNFIDQNPLQTYTLTKQELESYVYGNRKQLLSNKSKEKIESFIEDIEKGKQNHGIIDQIIEHKSHFIHRTFAEFLVARILVNCLKDQEMLQSISELLLNILLKIDYQVIRVFLNDQLKNHLLPDLGRLNNQSYHLKNTHIISIAICEKNLNIIKLLTNILNIEIKNEKPQLNSNHGFFEFIARNQIENYVLSLDKDGLYQYRHDRFDMAIDFFLQTYKLKQLIYQSPHQEIANSLNNLGMIYAKIRQYDQAIKYFKKSKEMLKLVNQKEESFENERNLAVYLNNLGSAYWNKSIYDHAINYYRQALYVILKLKTTSVFKELEGLKNNLLKLFAEKYSLSFNEIEDNLSIFILQEVDFMTHLNNIALSSDGSNEEEKIEKIKKYKLLLLFFPDMDLESKSKVFTELAELTKEDSKSIELWLALAEGNSNKVGKLYAAGAKYNYNSLINTSPILQAIAKEDFNNGVNVKNRMYDEFTMLIGQIGFSNISIENAKGKTPLHCLIEKQAISLTEKMTFFKDCCKMYDLNIKDQDGKLLHTTPQQLNYALEAQDISPVTKKARYDKTIKDQQSKAINCHKNPSIGDKIYTDSSVIGDHDHFPFYFLGITNKFHYSTYDY